LDLKEKGFCILTSRYSFEMALKTSRANMATVVAISAPTYRAYQLAQKLNQTLVAIARRDRQLVFCGSERIS
ncbi:formate dehydrogenase accessory sulfurtransferase FdhD, partial [Kozakia baliensis]